MKIKHLIVFLFINIFLSACGGGGSSSGGISNINDGDYNGTLTITTSSPNLINDSSSIAIGFTIQNNVVTSRTLDGTTAISSIPVVNNSFAFLEPSDIMAMDDIQDVECTIMIELIVTLSQGVANGTNTDTAECTALGAPIEITTTITLLASR